jgi:UDP-N-acetylglucosamine--N-acetylmuramyl-(pentapeptide) pyrophosphoryl-undecaprenol N-acetylglucosamine transferase
MDALLMVGRAGGPEERLVPAAGFELETVHVRGLDRDAPWRNVALPYLLPAAVARGLGILDRFRPDVVLGMGGYPMFPAIAAARLRRVPYVLHEKDVRPGLATRLFAGGAAAVCVTLAAGEGRIRSRRVVLTGVPLRAGFERRHPEAPARRLLVLGGSQGALHINQTVWEALDGLLERFQEVIHLTGAQGAAELERLRRDRYSALPFSEEVPNLMARADLILCRAGVGTLGEVTAVGLPSILVPGTFGGGHQEENARALVQAGAAVRIGDEELSAGRLLQVIDELDPGRLRAMAEASAALGRPDAASAVLRVVEEVAAA